MEQKLFTEMTIINYDPYLTARCPDEDDNMSITVKNRYRVTMSLTLQEAKDLSEYLNAHVQNALVSND